MLEEELHRLIDGCKKKDRQSQQLLYQGLYGFAMKICLRYTSSRYEAIEVLNEGFYKALTHIEKYDKCRPFNAWLSKIMYHASIDYYRANLKAANMEDLEKANDVTVDAVIERKLEYEDLLKMVQSLPNVCRVVFNLYAIDGYSHEEIAEMLGINAGTSRSNLYKARKKLQEMLVLPTPVNDNTGFRDMKIVSISQSDIDHVFRINLRKL